MKLSTILDDFTYSSGVVTLLNTQMHCWEWITLEAKVRHPRKDALRVIHSKCIPFRHREFYTLDALLMALLEWSIPNPMHSRLCEFLSPTWFSKPYSQRSFSHRENYSWCIFVCIPTTLCVERSPISWLWIYVSILFDRVPKMIDIFSKIIGLFSPMQINQRPLQHDYINHSRFKIGS